MWLVLCSSHDASAHWAYKGLGARGLAPLHMISAEALTYSRLWEHRLGADGAGVSFTLPDGRVFSDKEVRGVLNRMSWVSVGHLSVSRDHDYFSQEFAAFFMSWLYALPEPVLNRPTPQGLCGQWRHLSEWVLLASQAGLPTPLYRQSSFDRVDEMKGQRTLFPAGTPTRQAIVLSGRVFGQPGMPDEIRANCLRFAALSGTSLIGIDFSRGDESAWAFAGATPLPDLRAGGEPLLDVLAEELSTGAREATR